MTEPSSYKRIIRPGRNYIERYLWIRDKRRRLVRFILNPVQRYILSCKAKATEAGRPSRFLIPKARRMGVTTMEQGLSYSLAATRTGIRAVTLADSGQKTRQIFEISGTFWSESADEVRPDQHASDEKSTTRLHFHGLNSTFFVGTAGSVAYGRGDTLSRVHGSEVAYWLPGRDFEVVETLITGLTEAASHGEVTFESTSNGNTGWWYEACMEAEGGNNEWTVIFCPWFIDPTYRLPVTPAICEEMYRTQTDREAMLIEKFNLDWGQLYWRRIKSSEKAMRRLFLQEYPETLEESFIGSEACFFDPQTLEECRVAAAEAEPIEQEGDVTTWEYPKEGEKYVIGADTAEGLREGDWSVAYVLDREHGNQVCRIRGKLSTDRFAGMLDRIGRYYNRATLGVERQNHGHAVLQELIKRLYYPRLYAEVVAPTSKTRGARTTSSSSSRRRIGWHTDETNRARMIGDFRDLVEDGWLPRCEELAREMRTFENNGKGKFEARSGRHDDCVMAMSIAHQVRKLEPMRPKVTDL